MEKSLISEWELYDHWGVLTINNPPQNYLEKFLLADLEDLKRWTDSDSLKGMIITGKGRHFCAGFSKDDFLKDEKSLVGMLRKNNEILFFLEDIPIPVVAAINGVCFGGGLELVLSCDIRVCGDKALLSFPETGLGIIPGPNGTIRLPRRVCPYHAMELVLEGKVIHADEALALGLVDYVVPAKEVMDFSLRLLKRLTSDRPINVIHAIMKSLNNARKLPYAVATAEETKLFSTLVFAKDAPRQEIHRKRGEDT